MRSGWPIFFACVVLLALWAYHRAQNRLNMTAIGDTQAEPTWQPAAASGSQIPFRYQPDVRGDCIPKITLTPAFIPSSGFDAMTRIGNVNQPELLMDPSLFNRYRTAPIPQPTVQPQAVPNLPPSAMSEFELETVLPGGGHVYE